MVLEDLDETELRDLLLDVRKIVMSHDDPEEVVSVLQDMLGPPERDDNDDDDNDSGVNDD